MKMKTKNKLKMITKFKKKKLLKNVVVFLFEIRIQLKKQNDRRNMKKRNMNPFKSE